MSSDSKGIDTPSRLLQERYRACLEARDRWREAHNYGADVKRAMHLELQQAVSALYESARPLLKQNGEISEYWEGSPEKHLYSERVEVVEKDGERYLLRDLEPDLAEELREEGIPEPGTVYHGLSMLEDQLDQSEVIEESWSDSTGTHSRQRQRRIEIRPSILLRAARLIDEALTELDLLVSGDEPLAEDKLEDQS